MTDTMYLEFTDEKKQHELTTANFNKFKDYAVKWQSKLGLADWCIEFSFGNKDEFPDLDGNKAIAAMNRNGMAATICLNKNWAICSPTDRNLERCAIHELLELMLRPLNVLASARFNVDEADIEYETHRIIRRFENLLAELNPGEFN